MGVYFPDITLDEVNKSDFTIMRSVFDGKLKVYYAIDRNDNITECREIVDPIEIKKPHGDLWDILKVNDTVALMKLAKTHEERETIRKAGIALPAEE